MPTNLKYEDIEIGTLSLGPASKLCVRIVKYRDSTLHKKWHCDLRNFVYDPQRNRYYPTKKGISVKHGVILDIIEVLRGLTDIVPDFKADEMYEVSRLTNGEEIDIVISLCKHPNKDNIPLLDIREFVKKSFSGYVGFSQKGVRVGYHNRNNVADLLQDCYTQMAEINKKETTPYT